MDISVKLRKSLTAGILAAAMILTACAQDAGNKEIAGTLIGAGLGAWLGKEIGGKGTSGDIGIAVGAVAGAAIGRSIGADLDELDRQKLANAHYDAMENSRSGDAVRWTNPDSGNSGSVTALTTDLSDPDRPCRQFETTVNVGGTAEQGTGLACRNPDGSWDIVG